MNFFQDISLLTAKIYLRLTLYNSLVGNILCLRYVSNLHGTFVIDKFMAHIENNTLSKITTQGKWKKLYFEYFSNHAYYLIYTQSVLLAAKNSECKF